MRRIPITAMLLALAAGLQFGAPEVHGEQPVTADPTTTSDVTTSDVTVTGPATSAPDTIAPATRGSTIQLVPTLPPPIAAPPASPPTAPPTVAPKPPSTAVPANSGSGRRVIYSKGRMRVWLVDGNGAVVRTYLVSGRYSQPNYGTYFVYSRSSYTCNINHPNVCMRWMVRFAKGATGDNIGFHEIPRKDGVPLQSENQLGQALSSGCVRQSTADAQYMWGWGNIGAKVVVIP